MICLNLLTQILVIDNGRKRQYILNANNIYEEVEGEAGKNLSLEEDQQNNLVGIIKSRFALSEESRNGDERRWLKAYENFPRVI